MPKPPIAYKFSMILQIEDEPKVTQVVTAEVAQTKEGPRLHLDFGGFKLVSSLKPFRDIIRQNWKKSHL